MAADLTFDIAAIDKATQTFTKMAEQVDRLSRKLDKLDRKDVDVNVDVNADKAVASASRASKGIVSVLAGGATSISKNWVLMVGGMAAGLLALPTVASAASAGIVGALGGGIAAIPIIFAAQNEKVRDLWTLAVDRMKRKTLELSEPFEPVLAQIASMVTHAFDNIAPTLGEAFERMAPHVERFAGFVTDAFLELEPAILPVTEAFNELLDDIGPRLPGMMSDIAGAIEDIAETVEENPDMFGDLLEDAVMLTTNILKLIDTLARFNNFLDTVDDRIDRFRESLVDRITLTLSFNPAQAFKALEMVIGAAQAWAARKFVATLSATTTLVIRAVRAAVGLGLRFGARVFTATLNAANRVRRGFNAAMRLGRRWGARVFTATLNATVRVFAALRRAFAAASQWAGSVFTATFQGVFGGILGIPGRQHGGPVHRGGAFVVGEKGPELFVPNRDGRIVPHVPAGFGSRHTGGGDHVVLEIRSGGSRMDDLLVETLRRAVRVRGGDVQLVLGR